MGNQIKSIMVTEVTPLVLQEINNVTVDEKGQNAISHSKFLLEHLTEKIDGFYELVTLIEQSDKSGRVSFD